MLKSLVKKAVSQVLEGDRKQGVALAVGGMASLLTGNKIASLAAFGQGFYQLERAWRADHPDFDGDLSARFAESVRFYEETHQDPTNRKLHVIGIPMIVGGAAGLLLAPPFRPVWTLSAGAFVAGWALNIIGHARHEKNAPAFADDPLSFIAGPLWDVKQVMDKRRSKQATSPLAAVA